MRWGKEKLESGEGSGGGAGKKTLRHPGCDQDAQRKELRENKANDGRTVCRDAASQLDVCPPLFSRFRTSGVDQIEPGTRPFPSHGASKSYFGNIASLENLLTWPLA